MGFAVEELRRCGLVMGFWGEGAGVVGWRSGGRDDGGGGRGRGGSRPNCGILISCGILLRFGRLTQMAPAAIDAPARSITCHSI